MDVAVLISANLTGDGHVYCADFLLRRFAFFLAWAILTLIVVVMLLRFEGRHHLH